MSEKSGSQVIDKNAPGQSVFRSFYFLIFENLCEVYISYFACSYTAMKATVWSCDFYWVW